MNDSEIRIVDLPPMDFVRFHAFGPSPEHAASDKMRQWIKENEIQVERDQVRVFGFNNPSPSPGSENYGYECWFQVTKSTPGTKDLEKVKFSGGRYAVTRVKGVENIGDGWQKLVAWREGSKYQKGQHQWLEEDVSEAPNPSDEELVLDLLLPIVE